MENTGLSIIAAGLKTVQGKCVVNSISLKEGEDVFIDLAKTIKNNGGQNVKSGW